MIEIGRSQALSLATAALMVAGGAACGDDGTGPEGPGSVTVVVTDPGGSAGAAARTAAREGHFSGTFEGELQVRISTDGDTWVDVGSPSSVSVALQSGEETELYEEVDVEAGNYSHVQVRMGDAVAKIDTGADLGGTTFQSAVNVSVAGGSEVTVEQELFQFRVGSDSDIDLVVDLNSEAWITAETAESGNASEGDVRSAMAVSARAR